MAGEVAGQPTVCSNRISLKREESSFGKVLCKIKSRLTKSVPGQNLEDNKNEDLERIKNVAISKKTKQSKRLDETVNITEANCGIL